MLIHHLQQFRKILEWILEVVLKETVQISTYIFLYQFYSLK